MLHFLAYALLAFGPHVLVYRSTNLMEESALRSCILAGLVYGITQIFKIFVMATFLPSAELTDWTFIQEFLKSIVGVIELLGAHVAFTFIRNLSKFSHGTRILCIGLGWSFAQVLGSYLFPLWFGAKDFDLVFVEMGISANLDLLLNLSMMACVWLRTRGDLESQAVPLVWVGLLVHLMMPSILGYLTLVAQVGSWNVLIFRFVIGVALAVPLRTLIQRYSRKKNRA